MTSLPELGEDVCWALEWPLLTTLAVMLLSAFVIDSLTGVSLPAAAAAAAAVVDAGLLALL